MGRVGWYILAGLGVIILIAVTILWILAIWTNDVDVQSRLGFTGLVLVFPGILLTVLGFTEA